MALSALPSVLLVKIMGYLSFQQKHVSVLAVVNRKLHTILQTPVFWHMLSKTTWAREELYAQLPALSPPALYSILEKYFPLEGFYTLLNAFPWCFLCVLRFSEGEFIGEVIRFSRERGEAKSPGKRSLEETKERVLEERIPLFSIKFQEHEGVLQEICSLSADPALPVSINAGFAPVPFELEVARTLFHAATHVCPGYISAREGVSITLPPLGFANRMLSLLQRNERGLEDAWRPSSVPRETKAQTDTAITALLRASGLRLGLLVGTKTEGSSPQLASVLAQGLYVGHYGNDLYGQFADEVLRLSYVTFPEGHDLDAKLAQVFARVGSEGELPDNLRDALQHWRQTRNVNASNKGLTVSLVVVNKVTGDMHVCAGATSFVAVCAPQELVELLADASAPREVQCRETHEEVLVLEAWRGWGTLAFPGMRAARWNPGWLVGVQHKKFGFVWDGDRHREAILLQLIAAHHQGLFLDRQHLPPPLQ